MSNFFNSLLLAVYPGAAVSLTLLVWIEDNKGWDWGFGVSTVAIFLGFFLFVSRMPIYRFQAIRGNNAFVEIIQVSWANFMITYLLYVSTNYLEKITLDIDYI